MIIKSTRIPVAATPAIADYFCAKGENEKVRWIKGSVLAIRFMGAAARVAERAFGVRHVIISPGEPMRPRDLRQLIRDIWAEYDVSRDQREQSAIVLHQKRREGARGNDIHYHLTIPEVDTQSGRVMSSRFTKMRDEKLSRLVELRLGHAITPGRFNAEVFDALSAEYPDIDLAPFQNALEAAAEATGMDRADWRHVRAVSAYSTSEHQVLKRKAKAAGVAADLSLPKIKALIRRWSARMEPRQFVRHLHAHGYHLKPARKPGCWRLQALGQDLGAIDRLAGIAPDVIGEIMESQEWGHPDNRRAPPARPEARRGGRQSPDREAQA